MTTPDPRPGRMTPGNPNDSNDLRLHADGYTAGCRKFRVTGHVQGVFFRASTQTVARDLGLGGYARNLDDGSVEVLASGNIAALDALERWLNDGPPMASVAGVAVADVDHRPIDSFTTD